FTAHASIAATTASAEGQDDEGLRPALHRERRARKGPKRRALRPFVYRAPLLDVRLLPARVGVVRRHRRRDLLGRGPEILLVHDALEVARERHDAGHAVARRIENDAGPADQLAVGEVRVRAA